MVANRQALDEEPLDPPQDLEMQRRVGGTGCRPPGAQDAAEVSARQPILRTCSLHPIHAVPGVGRPYQAARWYSWISPPSTSTRPIGPVGRGSSSGATG